MSQRKSRSYRPHLPRLHARRFLAVAGIPLAGWLGFLLRFWVPHPDGFIVHPWDGACLSIPIAFFLWYRLMDREERLHLSFRWLPFLFSLSGFAAAVFLPSTGIPYFRRAIATLATLTGLFVWVSFWEVVHRARRHPRPTAIAGFAVFSLSSYSWFKPYFWEQTSVATTLLVMTLLGGVGAEVSADIQRELGSILLHSPDFAIRVYYPCSGLEGIFLCFSLLSALLLLDWPLFARWRCLELYLIAFLYMFLVNGLRITVIFLVGAWSGNADLAVDLFHSYTGWVLYLIAFGAFAAVLYRRAARERRQTG